MKHNLSMITLKVSFNEIHTWYLHLQVSIIVSSEDHFRPTGVKVKTIVVKLEKLIMLKKLDDLDLLGFARGQF